MEWFWQCTWACDQKRLGAGRDLTTSPTFQLQWVSQNYIAIYGVRMVQNFPFQIKGLEDLGRAVVDEIVHKPAASLD